MSLGEVSLGNDVDRNSSSRPTVKKVPLDPTLSKIKTVCKPTQSLIEVTMRTLEVSTNDFLDQNGVYASLKQ